MRQRPTTVSTEQLHRLLSRGDPLWLVYAPDHGAFDGGHIPGSLGASDAQLLATLPPGVSVVVYGEDGDVTRARELAAELAATGRAASWYAGGVRAWRSAGLPLEGAP